MPVRLRGKFQKITFAVAGALREQRVVVTHDQGAWQLGLLFVAFWADVLRHQKVGAGLVEVALLAVALLLVGGEGGLIATGKLGEVRF